MPKSTRRIIVESNIKWNDANAINPSFQQQGINLCWDEYYLEKKKAEDFDKNKWYSEQEVKQIFDDIEKECILRLNHIPDRTIEFGKIKQRWLK